MDTNVARGPAVLDEIGTAAGPIRSQSGALPCGLGVDFGPRRGLAKALAISSVSAEFPCVRGRPYTPFQVIQNHLRASAPGLASSELLSCELLHGWNVLRVCAEAEKQERCGDQEPGNRSNAWIKPNREAVSA